MSIAKGPVVKLRYYVFGTEIIGLVAEMDEAAIQAQGREVPDRLELGLAGMSDQLWFYDAEGRKQRTFHSILEELPVDFKADLSRWREGQTVEKDYIIANTALSVPEFGLLPLKRVLIRYQVKISELVQEIPLGRAIALDFAQSFLAGTVRQVGEPARN